MPRETKNKRETGISMVRLTDIEIMELLQHTAEDCGIRLTYMQKIFYIRLLAYALKHGEVCPEGLKISLSVNEMSVCLSLSKRMVIKCLRLLVDCGVILRYSSLDNATMSKQNTFPAKCITILKREFYERSKK